ncbi:hypothetical protein MHYP_G00333600 [Metynnis hypsauchen]
MKDRETIQPLKAIMLDTRSLKSKSDGVAAELACLLIVTLKVLRQLHAHLYGFQPIGSSTLLLIPSVPQDTLFCSPHSLRELHNQTQQMTRGIIEL